MLETGGVGTGALECVIMGAEVAVTTPGTEMMPERVIVETLYQLDILGVEVMAELFGLDICDDTVGGTA